MSVFIVYHGYCTPDNCDASEGSGPYQLDVCKTEKEVLKLREEHEEAIVGDDGEPDESCRPVFRVFFGNEMVVEATEKTVAWKLRGKT